MFSKVDILTAITFKIIFSIKVKVKVNKNKLEIKKNRLNNVRLKKKTGNIMVTNNKKY